VADTSALAKGLSPVSGANGQEVYRRNFSVALLFGLTELKAQLCWIENGTERRSEAAIICD
jgi:hypothetical protein